MPDPVLLYEFTPDKVAVSVGGANPIDSLVDLEVKINNRGPAAMVERIVIEIPMGGHGDTAGDRLSANAKLPDPEYDRDALADWTIKVDDENGSLVTIEPKSRKPTKLDATMELMFRGILVNDAPGIVPVTVDEFAPAHVKATFQIDKEDTTGPVQRFYVADENGSELNPATLYDLDQHVWLKWLCTEQGANYDYGLRTEEGEAWVPRDWRRTGEFFNCADGMNGVRTNKLGETTKFALEVIQGRSVRQILYTTLSVEVPSISEDSFVNKYLSGRLVSLNWRAFNAGRCVVELDGKVIDHNAPPDTYDDGYLIQLTEGQSARTPTVRAYARTGPAKTSRVFDPISVDPTVSIPTPLGLTEMVFTPNGKYALAVSEFSNQLFRINPATGEVVSITVGTSPTSIAVTPDSNLAFVVNSKNISVVDIENKTAAPNPISAGDYLGPMTISPDGTLALIANTWSRTVTVFNVEEKKVKGTVSLDESPVAVGIAATLKGYVGVVATTGATVRFINLNNWTVESDPIRTAANEWPALALTPDGKLAFVINVSNQTINVIDIGQRQLLPNVIPLAASAVDVVVTPDGKLALVLNTDGSLKVFKVLDLDAQPVTIQLGFQPHCMAVSSSANLFMVAPHIVVFGAPGSVTKFTLLETD